MINNKNPWIVKGPSKFVKSEERQDHGLKESKMGLTNTKKTQHSQLKLEWNQVFRVGKQFLLQK